MILQRMAKAFRRQDWWAVALELAIVVVGILLGLRVDDWNTARKERAEEARYLVQLADDVAAMREEVVSLRVRAEDHHRVTLEAVRGLQRGDRGPDAEAAVEAAIIAYQNSPPFVFKRATYDEMVSTGALARLSDHDLKRRVTSTFAALDRVGGDLEFRNAVVEMLDIHWDVGGSYRRVLPALDSLLAVLRPDPAPPGA